MSHRIGRCERVDDAVLATSELVSNAVEHGGESKLVAVRVFESDEIVRVEVAGGEARPHLSSLRRHPDPARLRGRGLEIVSAVTDRAGSLTGPGVWFEIDR
ncbi:MAG: ATP-binding protein [Acidimicrobiia bacterium]